MNESPKHIVSFISCTLILDGNTLQWGAKTIEDWIEYYRQRQENKDRINNYFDSLESMEKEE